MRRQFTSLCLIFCFIYYPSTAFTAEQQFNLKELALPSEVDGLGKSAGSVYYSPVVKDKVLIPVHIWGSVQKPGLHFVPAGTKLVEGLSLAGGPSNTANLRRVRVSKEAAGKSVGDYYDLEEGGTPEAISLELSPKDTIFVERSTFSEDRAYYTSLIGVIATVLSSVLLWREIRRD